MNGAGNGNSSLLNILKNSPPPNHNRKNSLSGSAGNSKGTNGSSSSSIKDYRDDYSGKGQSNAGYFKKNSRHVSNRGDGRFGSLTVVSTPGKVYSVPERIAELP